MIILLRNYSRTLIAPALAAVIASSTAVSAADYTIDDAHTTIGFKVSHLGVSWLEGRFNRFAGEFAWDADSPAKSAVAVTIDAASLDTNHAERDKHLRSADFLTVKEHPEIRFVGSGFEMTGTGRGVLSGDLTFFGTTRPASIQVTPVGEGPDPWGGYRAGFKGELEVQPSEFGMKYDLGPAASTVYITLNVEGVRQ